MTGHPAIAAAYGTGRGTTQNLHGECATVARAFLYIYIFRVYLTRCLHENDINTTTPVHSILQASYRYILHCTALNVQEFRSLLTSLGPAALPWAEVAAVGAHCYNRGVHHAKFYRCVTVGDLDNLVQRSAG